MESQLSRAIVPCTIDSWHDVATVPHHWWRTQFDLAIGSYPNPDDLKFRFKLRATRPLISSYVHSNPVERYHDLSGFDMRRSTSSHLVSIISLTDNYPITYDTSYLPCARLSPPNKVPMSFWYQTPVKTTGLHQVNSFFRPSTTITCVSPTRYNTSTKTRQSTSERWTPSRNANDWDEPMCRRRERKERRKGEETSDERRLGDMMTRSLSSERMRDQRHRALDQTTAETLSKSNNNQW